MQNQEKTRLTSASPPLLTFSQPPPTRRILAYVLTIGTLGSGIFIAPPNTKASGASVPAVNTRTTFESDHLNTTQGLEWYQNSKRDRGRRTERTIPIDHVSVQQTDDSAYVLGYGVHREPAIELKVWHVEGEPRLAARLPSGAYLFVSVHEGKATIDAQDREAVAAQLTELNKALDVTVETEQTGWLDCAVSAAGAVGGCVVASVIGCVGGSIMAACDCLPLVVEEFEAYDCPGMS